MITYRTCSEANTKELGRAWGRFLRTYNDGLCCALIGDLGVGKTHFSQGIAEGFGVKEEVTSPTFALMNTYEVEGDVLYHFDLYRMDLEEELEAIGFYEYTEGQKSIVEWADKFESALPEELVQFSIAVGKEGARFFQVTSDTLTDDELRSIGGAYVFGD